MSLSHIAWMFSGLLLGFNFGRLIGARQGEEAQLSKAEKAILVRNAAEPVYLWPYVAVIFVNLLGLPLFFLVFSEEDIPVQMIHFLLWLGAQGVLLNLASIKRQQLVREILSRRPA